MTAIQRLPIDDILPAIGAALDESNSVVVQAPTGAGKTTRVPPFLADQPWARGELVVMLEPRRVAARAAAARIAEERGAILGREVGFAVRFEQRFSAQTRILVCTDGVFLRRLQADPFLENTAAVVLDEFHERSANIDLALALLRQVQKEARPDLRIAVMSATLETGPLAKFLGDCPIVDCQGRLHPIAVEYAGPHGPPDLAALSSNVKSVVVDVLERTAGDVLVFLPGVGEIRRCETALEAIAAQRNTDVVPLYGDLSLEAQSFALRRGPRRKIVLATNVAETSVTVEGVAAVVDSGLSRVLRFDVGVGVDRLELGRISQESAEQRKGRAGRTASGVCVRLWTQREQLALAARTPPEIARVDLAGTLLEIHQWGETDPTRFPWYERPSDLSLRQARSLLRELGAVDDVGRITEHGKKLIQLPAHPRLGNALLAGAGFGVLDEAASAAALLGERDPFVRSDRRKARTSGSSDLAEKVAALAMFRARGERFSDVGELQASSAKSVLRVADQLARSTGSIAAVGRAVDRGLERALFAAYPDRLAKRRSPGSPRAVMVGGRGLKLSESSVVHDGDLFVGVEIAPLGGSDDLVVSASIVDREWIDPADLTTTDVVEFDWKEKRVAGRRQLRFRDLVIEESPTSSPESVLVERALADAAAQDLANALGLQRDEIVRFRARVGWLRETMPELELPTFDDEALRALLPELCIGKKSFAELSESNVGAAMENALAHHQRSALQREAPERWTVPTGSKIALHYELGMPPVLAVRIQELFGVTDSPRLAAGRASVVLHLLAPNHRPQQVTDDLRSFWTNIYPKIRKELRMNYPKHAWPEDPLMAAPVRKGPSQKK